MGKQQADAQKPQRGRPPTHDSPRRNVTMALPVEIIEELDREADATGTSRTELVLEAISQRKERQQRERSQS